MDSLRLRSPLEPSDVWAVLPGMFWDHDCVMLPGLGGFVCNPRSARFDEAKCEIVPPSRDVLFNPRLTTNDGLLANELMRRHGVDYREALGAVESFVGFISESLDRGESVTLPGVGRLYREDDAQVRFMADVEFERMLRSFGHTSIPLTPLAIGTLEGSQPQGLTAVKAATQTPKQAEKHATLAPPEAQEIVASQSDPTSETETTPKVIPFRVQLGRVAAAVALPLTMAGAWLLSNPSGNQSLLNANPLWNAQPVAATFAPRPYDHVAVSWEVDEAVESPRAFVERTGWEGLLRFDVERGQPAATGMLVVVPESAIDPELDDDSERVNEWDHVVVPESAIDSEPEVEEGAKEASPEPATASAPEVRFMIVGGAFSVVENAQNLANTLSRQGFQTSLHLQPHNGLTVVSLGGYATESEARSALSAARTRGQEKAWLKKL
ncbi:MAG: SPOR domain-containing protein [Bacteroidetes bacterium]|nr:SPOR domain-containing protein [Bacteroidota bacterium]